MKVNTSLILLTIVSGLTFISGNSFSKLQYLADILYNNHSISNEGICENIQSTNSIYSSICKDKPEVINLIALATSAALDECNRQLKYYRWNCDSSKRLFRRIIEKYSKETAFLNAITTAAITYYVTKACSRGDMKFCQCSTNQPQYSIDPINEQPIACNENIDYGKSFSEVFIDGPAKHFFETMPDYESYPKVEKKKKYQLVFKTFLELYNNNVARNILLDSLETKCKCQGPSGSCASKYCWKKLPEFSKIGHALKESYLKAMKMPRFVKKRIRRSLITVDDISTLAKKSEFETDQLMYLKESFDYCVPNKHLGISGIHGRECENIPQGPTSCSHLCCNYGFVKVKKLEVEQCNCKFKWCCKVECDSCKKTVVRYYCNIPQTFRKFHKYYLRDHHV